MQMSHHSNICMEDDSDFVLRSAQHYIEKVLHLIEGNEYENYMGLKLTSVWYELDRQLSHLKED